MEALGAESTFRESVSAFALTPALLLLLLHLRVLECEFCFRHARSGSYTGEPAESRRVCVRAKERVSDDWHGCSGKRRWTRLVTEPLVAILEP